MLVFLRQLGWYQARNDRATVGHNDSFAPMRSANVGAEAVFQFADTDRFHKLNVASCGYIGKAAQYVRALGGMYSTSLVSV